MGYLHNVLDPSMFKKKVKKLIKSIRESGIEFDYIVGTGISGIIVIGAVASGLDKKILIVRKDGEGTHGVDFEYPNDWDPTLKKFIIIDDGIATGKTIRRIFNRMTDSFFRGESIENLCKGIFLYNLDVIGWTPDDVNLGAYKGIIVISDGVYKGTIKFSPKPKLKLVEPIQELQTA